MSILDLRPNDLIICIDETGSESLADPRHPVFGLGGCAVTGANYITALESPWKQIKAQHFDGADKPLHAAKISSENSPGIGAIAEFFRTAPIARFATVLGRRTSIGGVNTDTYQALALTFSDQIGRVLKQFEYYRLVLAFERSERGDAKVMEHFSTLQPILAGPEGPFRGPVERCLVPKQLAFAAMEVADFIIQAAGGQARIQEAGGGRMRPDFECVFKPSAGRFTEIIFATGIHVR